MDSKVDTILYAAKHKSIGQFRTVNNKMGTLLQSMVHHIIERTFRIVGRKPLMLIPIIANFKVRALAVISCAA